MEEDKSIKEMLKEIHEKLELGETNKTKKGFWFWLPFASRVGKNKAQKGWATVMVIRDNRNITFQKQPIDEQTVMVDGVPRLATADDTLYYKGKPFIILPSWSVKPFSPTDNLNQTDANKYNSTGFRLLLNKIQSEGIKPKKSISMWVIFMIIVGIIALGYFATKGGLF